MFMAGTEKKQEAAKNKTIKLAERYWAEFCIATFLSVICKPEQANAALGSLANNIRCIRSISLSQAVM